MAAMTMKSPSGAITRTRSKRQFALVIDWSTFDRDGSPIIKGLCILRTDNPHRAVKDAKAYTRETGRPCWIYNTVAQRREYI